MQKRLILDLDAINFTWTANGGNFMGLDSLVEWKAPASEGIYVINVKLQTQGLSSSASTQILVRISLHPLEKQSLLIHFRKCQ
ncbi:MAG: hypothetical protein IPL23_26805 [Saprospiraceae bacterium]|nr:hypothetical protein [Saprospiraceae bacterium]